MDGGEVKAEKTQFRPAVGAAWLATHVPRRAQGDERFQQKCAERGLDWAFPVRRPVAAAAACLGAQESVATAAAKHAEAVCEHSST